MSEKELAKNLLLGDTCLDCLYSHEVYIPQGLILDSSLLDYTCLKTGEPIIKSNVCSEYECNKEKGNG